MFPKQTFQNNVYSKYRLCSIKTLVTTNFAHPAHPHPHHLPIPNSPSARTTNASQAQASQSEAVSRGCLSLHLHPPQIPAWNEKMPSFWCPTHDPWVLRILRSHACHLSGQYPAACRLTSCRLATCLLYTQSSRFNNHNKMPNAARLHTLLLSLYGL